MSDSTPILSTEAADEAAGSATTCLEISLLEFAPAQRPLVDEVVEGLTAEEKFLPAKLHYDQRGSELFEQICQLEEYYITRTELAIMRDNVVQVADQLGPGCLLIEPGSGASLKTRLLLGALDSPAGYVPVDISRDFLLESAAAIARRHDVEVLPVWADFTKPHPVPEPDADVEAKAVYFPGSTVGNFTRRQAEGLLGRFAAMVGGKDEAEGAEAGSVLVGFDQKKDVARMEAAYNDAEGVTAEFNYNVIDRLARELDVPLDREKFSFRADWDEQTGAIVSRLWAREAHEVVIAGRRVCFDEGEPICMEESHKYTPEEFEALAASVGLRTEQIWTDAAADFAVVHLRA